MLRSSLDSGLSLKQILPRSELFVPMTAFLLMWQYGLIFKSLSQSASAVSALFLPEEWLNLEGPE